jgi:hypothetical protein
MLKHYYEHWLVYSNMNSNVRYSQHDTPWTSVIFIGWPVSSPGCRFPIYGIPLGKPTLLRCWAPEAAGCPKGDLGGNELRMLLYFLSPPFSPILYGFTMLYNGLLGWYFWDLLVTSPVAATEPPGSGAPFRAAGSELFQTTADCLPHDCNVQHEGRFVGLGVGG